MKQRLLNIRSLSSDSDQKIDLLSLTKTWLHLNEYMHVNSHVPWEFGRGGGVAAIFNSSLLINPKPKLSYNSFECLVLSLPHPSKKFQQPIIFAVVYCASGAYAEFLSNLVLKTDQIVVFDFNIHIDNNNDSLSVAFISILDSIVFSQCVHQASVAKLIMGECGHIPPLLASLHWLPVPSRIELKILLLTSQNSGLLVVPKDLKSRVGARAFSSSPMESSPNFSL